MVATHRRGGKVVGQRQFVCGDLSPEEIALGKSSGLGWRIGDTENRALRSMASDVKAGDRLRFSGDFEPCPSCQKTMVDFAKKHNVQIDYAYVDRANRARVWSANQGGYVYIGT
jgi:hypothetical protein